MEDDAIRQWTPVRRIMPAKVALSSYDFKHLNSRPASVEQPNCNDQGDVLGLEVYEYAGAYGFKGWDEGDVQASLRIQEIDARGKHYEASGNDRFVQPRRWFQLTGHFDQGLLRGDETESRFLVLDVRHRVRNNYLQGANAPAYYANEFTCIRKKIPWCPVRGLVGKDPKIHGPQTAIVVGPEGEDVHTDEYGRVKVQFHWDRMGQYDVRSSAWIRVSSSLAGQGFGEYVPPRVGQEVIVFFLGGNPDRPIITGCVPNAQHMPMHGRPRLAKRSIHDGSKVEIAAMHPDFDVRHHAWLSLMESADPSPYHSHALRVLGHVRVGSVTV